LNFISEQTRSILFILVSVALFAATSLMAKGLGTDALGNALHPVQISSGRFCFAFLALLPVFLWHSPGVTNAPWPLHIKRSVCGWLGVSCLFAAATQIPLADANAISFLSVIITMALSIPLLGERVGLKRWSAAFLALAGAVMISRPGTDAFHPAALVAFMAAVFIGLEAVFTKILSDREPPIRILMINNTIGATISVLVVPFFWLSPDSKQWGVLVAIGMVMVLAQYFNIQAMKRGDVSFVVPFWYAAPLFAAIYDYLLFRQIISMWSVVGITMIIMGGIIISYRERIKKVAPAPVGSVERNGTSAIIDARGSCWFTTDHPLGRR